MPTYVSFFVAVLLFIFGGLVLRASPTRSLNRQFTIFAVSSGFWAIGVGAAHTGHHVDFWTALAFASAAFIAASCLAFITAHAPGDRWSAHPLILVVYGVAATFALLSFTTPHIFSNARLVSSGIHRSEGVLYKVFAIFILLICIAASSVFISKWKRARGRARAHLQYLGAGLLLPVAGGILTNLIWPLITGRSTYSWVGPFFGLTFAAIVGHGIVRRRIPDLRLVIHRGLTLATAIILSALPAALLVAIYWPKVIEVDSLDLGVLVAAVALVTLATPLTRDLANRVLDRYVYRTQADYQRTVREASEMLTRVLQLDRLLAFISATISRTISPEGVAVYLLTEEAFSCATSTLRPDAEIFSAPGEAPQIVVTALQQAREPVLLEDLVRENDAASIRLQTCLSRYSWSLVLPVISEDTLIAIVVVGHKLSGDPFYPQDLDLLMTLSNQAGVAIRNAQLYAEVVLTKEYLENIVATIESGVVAVGASGKITMFNRASEYLTGLTAESVLGKHTSAIPACVAEPLEATMGDGEARTQPEVELPCVTPDGPPSRPVICTVSPVRDQGGAVLGAVAVFSDLTPLKELELERRRAERLAYFQALAAGIAHEIKNPLVAIKTFAQLLPRRQQDARFLGEFARISTREIDRMQRLVDRLRTLSRPAGGPRHPVDVRLPLGEALELARPTLEEKGLRLTAGLGADPCIILGNHPELEELFLNLILNAHDATPAGGTVTVEVTSSESHATVTVTDSGPGIAPELLERVFEPFFTTKARGSGLGLAISAGIAQAHGAKLRVHNRPGGGAVFTVEFPLATVVPLVVS